MVTLAFNAHWSDFLSGTLLLSSGLRFRSNDHSLKHAYSLRPCSSSTTRGPYMLGAREAPGGILGSLGSPRGYASDYVPHCKLQYCRRSILNVTALKLLVMKDCMSLESEQSCG